MKQSSADIHVGFKMNGIQMIIYVFSLLDLFLHVSFGNTSTTKSKRCVEYRQQEGRRKQTILGIVMNTTEKDCFIQCVRNQHCKAYNIWHGNGTCELLPKFRKCGEIEKQNGCTFVHLGDCNKGVPWYTVRRDWGAESTCLRWQYFDYISECPSAYKRAPAEDYCVALIAYRGLYLPGWYREGDKFGSVTPDEGLAYCRSGYLLQVASICSVVWREYTVGDLVPERAVVGGIWKDGSPLYIVADYIQNTWAIGYYRPSVQRSFIMIYAEIYNPQNMKILLAV